MQNMLLLQIILASFFTSIIKEFYDSTKQQEPVRVFIAEVLMSTVVGVIFGLLVYRFIPDDFFVLGIAAASSIGGIDGFNKRISMFFGSISNNNLNGDGSSD